MPMSRKDYVKLADALRDARIASSVLPGKTDPMQHWQQQHDRYCTEVAKALRGTNERFDEGRFLAACNR
jgi:hypothetical protein